MAGAEEARGELRWLAVRGHEIEEGVAVQKINPRLFGRLPPLKSQAERFNPPGWGQGTPKKIVRHCLQGSSFFGRSLLELAEKPIVDSYGGTSHTRKHFMSASRCQTRLFSPEGE